MLWVIVSSLWCEIVYFHWFSCTMTRQGWLLMPRSFLTNVLMLRSFPAGAINVEVNFGKCIVKFINYDRFPWVPLIICMINLEIMFGVLDYYVLMILLAVIDLLDTWLISLILVICTRENHIRGLYRMTKFSIFMLFRFYFSYFFCFVWLRLTCLDESRRVSSRPFFE